ncbi:MAG: GspE/PulE family protein [Bacillota bacterium]|nr:GspE/PulE family protein [Bacillota bacterium]
MKNIRIGEVLKEYGYINDEQLDKALEVQRSESRHKRLGSIFLEMGYLTEDQLLEALARRLDLPLVNIEDQPLNIEVVSLIPRQLAAKYTAIAMSIEHGRLTVAVNDPLDFYAIEDIRQITNMPVSLVLASEDSIVRAIDYYYSEISAQQSAIDINEVAEDIDDDEAPDEAESDNPVVNMVNSLLLKANSSGASDIHIEPFEDKTQVRIRIDGSLVNYVDFAASMHDSVIARIKIMSALDIAEKRAPQDGHFHITLEGMELNVRVSVIPTIYGEKAVLRFLAGNVVIDHSGTFGVSDNDSYEKLCQMLDAPYGIIYFTGPTGSGKTTTLYMILERLSRRPINISTIEDPVERNLANINQMQVNPLAGLTFDTGLQALLRQDPDVIMVGETRDSKTASISVRGSITGHLVLSTLHTNDAVSSIVRLADMGVPLYLIANAMVGTVAQRLVRKVCDNCAVEYDATAGELEVLGVKEARLRRGVGCHHCNHTGYKGRIAVHEIFVVDNTVRRMISEKATMDDIEKYAIEGQKMKTLRDDVMDLVLQGKTTVEEMRKITCFSE